MGNIDRQDFADANGGFFLVDCIKRSVGASDVQPVQFTPVNGKFFAVTSPSIGAWMWFVREGVQILPDDPLSLFVGIMEKFPRLFRHQHCKRHRRLNLVEGEVLVVVSTIEQLAAIPFELGLD